MIVLGIESSCDETAASIVEDGQILLSNVIATSMDLHLAFGGVVPEIAARSHIESIIPVIQEALDGLRVKQPHFTDTPSTEHKSLNLKFDPWDYIDAIAVTQGAGLAGSLLVGVMTAKTLAILKNKPLYGINHVEAHLYVNFLTKTSLPNYQLATTSPQFPILGLIVSGGHTQLVMFEDHFNYKLLGQTRDDAIGEAFDKVAKIIGLPYPGGPSIAKTALKGNPKKYKLPKAKLNGKYEFSFSGLKTAVLRLAQEEIGQDYTYPSYKISRKLSEVQKCDIAASFQYIAIQTVVDKTVNAYKEFKPKSLIIGGGVSANLELRQQLSERLLSSIEYPDLKLCTDNAAMIATLGCYKKKFNQPTTDPHNLSIQPNLSM